MLKSSCLTSIVCVAASTVITFVTITKWDKSPLPVSIGTGNCLLLNSQHLTPSMDPNGKWSNAILAPGPFCGYGMCLYINRNFYCVFSKKFTSMVEYEKSGYDNIPKCCYVFDNSTLLVIA